VHPLALFADYLLQLGDGTSRRIGGGSQRLEHFQRDVELAYWTKRPRQAPHVAFELPAARAARDQGERLTQTPGRDSRLVEVLRIALRRSRKGSGQGVQSLADEEL
jgi:hypothetical protein